MQEGRKVKMFSISFSKKLCTSGGASNLAAQRLSIRSTQHIYEYTVYNFFIWR